MVLPTEPGLLIPSVPLSLHGEKAHFCRHGSPQFCQGGTAWSLVHSPEAMPKKRPAAWCPDSPAAGKAAWSLLPDSPQRDCAVNKLAAVSVALPQRQGRNPDLPTPGSVRILGRIRFSGESRTRLKGERARHTSLATARFPKI